MLASIALNRAVWRDSHQVAAPATCVPRIVTPPIGGVPGFVTWTFAGNARQGRPSCGSVRHSPSLELV